MLTPPLGGPCHPSQCCPFLRIADLNHEICQVTLTRRTLEKIQFFLSFFFQFFLKLVWCQIHKIEGSLYQTRDFPAQKELSISVPPAKFYLMHSLFSTSSIRTRLNKCPFISASLQSSSGGTASGASLSGFTLFPAVWPQARSFNTAQPVRSCAMEGCKKIALAHEVVKSQMK